MRELKSRKWVVLLGGVLALAVAGGAIAYWTGGGTGSGSATAGTSGTVALTATIGSGIALGLHVPVTFKAANASSSAIRVTTVHLVGVEADAGHSGCVTADFTMEDVTQNHDVPAGATAETLPQNGTLVYADTAVSQDACKGATLTLTLSSV